MFCYAIEAALQSEAFSEIYLNTENSELEIYAKEYGINFYLRDHALASSETQSDDVVYDFMKARPAQITAWVNTASPLQKPQEIKGASDHFLLNSSDSLITSFREPSHTLFRGKPINFQIHQKFAQTQTLEPIERLVYSTMIWRNERFCLEYEQHGFAMMCGNFSTFPVSRTTSFTVKYAEDLELARTILGT